MTTQRLDTASALAVSVLRGGRGLVAQQSPKAQPTLPLQLWEFEACPYCRKVRETLTELDLEYVARASARGAANRSQLSKQQFPFLVDPNTGVSMYESEDIIDYLHATYGQERRAISRWLSPINTATAAVAGAVRIKGRKALAPRQEQPKKTLVLYNFEASPYCRKVREALCELDLDCHIKNVARRSPRRDELKELGGRMMVPYLIDENTGVSMYESADIVAYLRETYPAAIS